MRIRIYRLIDTGELFIKTGDCRYMEAADYFEDGGPSYQFGSDELEFLNSFDFRTECDKAEEFIYAN